MEQLDNLPKRNLGKTLLRFVVSFGLMGIILYLFRAQLPTVLQYLKDMRPFYFIMAVVVFFIGLISVAYRLCLIIRVHGTKLSVAAAYYVNLIALFFNNVLPSSVGGEMMRAYYLYKDSKGSVSVFSAVVVDRLFGLITMLLISISTIFFFDSAQGSHKIMGSIIMLAATTVTLAIFIFNKKIVDVLCQVHIPLLPAIFIEKVREIYRAMYEYREHKGIFGRCIALTIAGQTTYIIANYLLARSLAIDIPLGFFFFFVPILLLLGVAPSVNGIGVREATFLFYLTEFTTSEKALALSLLTTFFMILVGMISGIIYAFKGGLSSEDKKVASG
ncbi:MAG: lysylphosphatidylglycerol synthase transmembrane domain-containing protein [Desulfobulbales bacterium]